VGYLTSKGKLQRLQTHVVGAALLLNVTAHFKVCSKFKTTTKGIVRCEWDRRNDLEGRRLQPGCSTTQLNQIRRSRRFQARRLVIFSWRHHHLVSAVSTITARRIVLHEVEVH